jgi:hypothetical protein
VETKSVTLADLLVGESYAFRLLFMAHAAFQVWVIVFLSF